MFSKYESAYRYMYEDQLVAAEDDYLEMFEVGFNNCAVNPPDSSVWDIRRHMTFSESHDAQTKNGVPKYKFEELHIII